MAIWDSYELKENPKDNDTLLIKDTDGGLNKRILFSAQYNGLIN